ncbi:hypothetical protein AB0J80_33035 [Actinoplanes sp. NPDC049548]|uniref:hypothetical protein n=1 Tax=Actinoplanes sp. NPDC049548 TaxID=3155152 RepID=UPI003424BF4F
MMGSPPRVERLPDDLRDQGRGYRPQLEHLGRPAGGCGDDLAEVQPRVVEGRQDLQRTAGLGPLAPDLDPDVAGIDLADGPSVGDVVDDDPSDTSPCHDGKVRARRKVMSCRARARHTYDAIRRGGGMI